jgi:hypothetical protein
MLDAIPWPNAVGKRCVVLGRYATAMTSALEERGAAVVVAADIGHLEELGAEPFDLTFGWGVVTDAGAPLERLQAVRQATRGLFISIEPIDALLTIGMRSIPLLRLAGGAHGRAWSMNGRCHHRLLGAAGFTVEPPSRIVAVGSEPAVGGPAEQLLGRVLTKGRPGTPHRALIGRARP